MAPERVQQDRLSAMFTAQAEMMAQPLTTEQVESLLDQQRAVAATQGVDQRLRTEAVKRGLTVRDGQTWLRPNAHVTTALRESDEFVDSLPVFQKIVSPFLIVLATKNLPGIPEDFIELMDAFHAGLRRDLAMITAQQANVHVHEIDASHDMVFESPGHVATLVSDFLRRAGH
jgi:pimeloyl-ACP methyl ester carboxylesterase